MRGCTLPGALAFHSEGWSRGWWSFSFGCPAARPTSPLLNAFLPPRPYSRSRAPAAYQLRRMVPDRYLLGMRIFGKLGGVFRCLVCCAFGWPRVAVRRDLGFTLAWGIPCPSAARSSSSYHSPELSAAFVSFKSRCGAALVAQTQQHINPLIWMTELAPEPRDVIWRNLDTSYSIQTFHRIGVFVATFLLTVFFAIPVTAVQGIVQFEKLKKWFPPARAVQLIPGLSSILTGYLPSAILNGFIYVVPFAMLQMASFEGSLLEQIGKSFTHPKDIPSRLASAVSAQSDFFITYILTNGLSGFSLEVVQLGLFSWHLLRSKIFRQSTQRDSYLFGFPYYRVVPIVSLAILLGMVYAVVAPLLLPFLIVYFLLGYAVYVNQMEDVYEITYETYGEYWPCIHHYVIIAIILMQITMIGIFGLKSKPGPSVSTIVLLLVTVLFNEYCKIQFLPTFHHFPIQVAKENDERDEMEGMMEANQVAAINAYRPPWMRPVCIDQESSSMQPLVSSSEA